MCADLHSSWVPLFIPCPNAKGFGENQDKWIPNPLSLTSLHLSMYAFVGKLMGIAGTPLPRTYYHDDHHETRELIAFHTCSQQFTT